MIRQKAIKVFISYSHDSREHIDKVLLFSNSLRRLGIDSTIDQYVFSPEVGWPRWMDKQLRDSDYVIMIITESYGSRMIGEASEGKGIGVKWEAHLIYQYLYAQGTLNKRFIPVTFNKNDSQFIPILLQAFTNYIINRFDITDKGFNDLYIRLSNKILNQHDKLGKIVNLGLKEKNRESSFIKSNLKFFSDFLNIALDSETSNQMFSLSRIKGMSNYVVMSLLDNQVNSVDPVERYWAYVTLGRIATTEAVAFLKNVKENNMFARQGIHDAMQFFHNTTKKT